MGELDADIADATCDFAVRLKDCGWSANFTCGMEDGVRRWTYKAHESVRVGLLLLASTASIWLALGAELLAHSSTVVVHLSCVVFL